MDEKTEVTLNVLSRPTLHVCLDMQNVFAEETAWRTPGLVRIVPSIERLIAARPEETVFTKFVPPLRPDNAHGAWQDFFERWADFTTEKLPSHLLEIVPRLARFAHLGTVIEKPAHSAFVEDKFRRLLRDQDIETIVVTGRDTDVGVLATVLGAVDSGYRVVIARDGLCGSSDRTQDTLLEIFKRRFGTQVLTSTVDEIVSIWKDGFGLPQPAATRCVDRMRYQHS